MNYRFSASDQLDFCGCDNHNLQYDPDLYFRVYKNKIVFINLSFIRICNSFYFYFQQSQRDGAVDINFLLSEQCAPRFWKQIATQYFVYQTEVTKGPQTREARVCYESVWRLQEHGLPPIHVQMCQVVCLEANEKIKVCRLLSEVSLSWFRFCRAVNPFTNLAKKKLLQIIILQSTLGEEQGFVKSTTGEYVRILSRKYSKVLFAKNSILDRLTELDIKYILTEAALVCIT